MQIYKIINKTDCVWGKNFTGFPGGGNALIAKQLHIYKKIPYAFVFQQVAQWRKKV